MNSILAIVLSIGALSFAHAAAAQKDIPGFKYLGTSEVQQSGIGINGVGIMASYYLSRDSANWVTAFSNCNDIGGRLAYPMNPVANDELRRFLVVEDLRANAWIGARSTGTNWIWESNFNTAMSWSSWASGCGTGYNACGYFISNGGTWCHAGCSSTMSYICQF
ncbi:lithostathine-1-beta [Folsomia candida]|uniref:lithostathine-1-beta n=1 Tax=Folsomia candida TaxID=158441 RepID=UPI000B8FC2CC|nr:lithostathine-1-beta [Folsomia candida]